MSQSVRFYAHSVSTALELRLATFVDAGSNLSIDVREIDEAQISSSSRDIGYDLFSANVSWTRLRFRLTADLNSAEIVGILRPTSSLSEDTALIVLITCAATKYRHGVRLNPTEPGYWSAFTTLQRSDVKAAVTFRPQLVRTTGIPVDDIKSLATKAGAVIALGNPVTLYIDKQPRAVSSSSVNISWEDFANSEHPWRREHHNDVFHLDPFLGEPRLFLNTRYRQLREVIESDAKRGPEAALREMMASMIAQPVLLQMSLIALTSLELDEDSQNAQPPAGWRADVLGSLMPRLFPEESSGEQRLIRAAREIRESDGAASLISRLGSVIQEMVGSHKTLELAARTLENVSEREEPPND